MASFFPLFDYWSCGTRRYRWVADPGARSNGDTSHSEVLRRTGPLVPYLPVFESAQSRSDPDANRPLRVIRPPAVTDETDRFVSPRVPRTPHQSCWPPLGQWRIGRAIRDALITLPGMEVLVS